MMTRCVPVLLAALILLAGCSHYRLGTQSKPDFSTLYIAPIENRAGVAQGIPVISTQLREAFLRDGRVRIVNSPEAADATVHVTLVRLHRTVATVLPDDTGRARKFDLTLDAVCTLRDRRKGTAYFEDRPISAYRQTFAGDAPPPPSEPRVPYVSNQLQAEYNVLPLLATTLADRVTHAVLDVW